MRSIIILIVTILTSLVSFSFGIDSFSDPSIYPQTKDQVVGDRDIRDPLRDGTQNISDHVNGIINDHIDNSAQAQNQTINVIIGIVNYFLGILALLSLIYLLYHGFLMVTASGDEGKYKKGFQGVRHAAIVIVAIGVSWYLISLVFTVILKVAL